MMEETGMASCPVVFVGDVLVGGFAETVEADRSGRLRELIAATDITEDAHMTEIATTADVDILRALNDSYIRSDQNSDVATYATFLADDFVANLPDLVKRNRAEFLELIAGPRPFTDLTLEGVQIRILGDVALLHGRVSYVTKHDGERREALYTDTYQRRDGRWLCIAADVIARGE